MTKNNYMGKIDEDYSGTTIPNYDTTPTEKKLYTESQLKQAALSGARNERAHIVRKLKIMREFISKHSFEDEDYIGEIGEDGWQKEPVKLVRENDVIWNITKLIEELEAQTEKENKK